MIYEYIENKIEPELDVILSATDESIFNSLKSSNKYVIVAKPNLIFPSITNTSTTESPENHTINPNPPENSTFSANAQNEPNSNDLVYNSIAENQSNLEQGLFFYTLNEVQSTIIDITNENHSINLDGTVEKSMEWQSYILDHIRLNLIIDSKEIDSMCKHLENLLTDTKRTLHQDEFASLYSLENVSDRLKSFRKNRDNNVDVGDSESDKDKLDEFVKMLRLRSGRYLFNKMVSALQKLEQSIYNITHGLRNQSQNTLDESQWRLQFKLRDIQVLFRQMSEEIPHRDAVERNFDKLSEFIDTLFDFHKRINLCSDKMKMVKHFEIMSADQLGLQEIINNQLNNAMHRLQKTIQMNLIMDEYHLIMHAFKQHQFPFVHEHMIIFELPKSLQFNDPETLKQKILKQIDYLIEKLKFMDITKYDRNIFRDVDFGISNASILGPFYVWDNEEIKEKLPDFLRGKEIEIIADINKAVLKSAVKFNVIVLRFKAPNDTQEQLNNELKNFSIALTLAGNYSYRYDDKIYCIPIDDNIVLTYSFKKDLNGNPFLANDVCKKVSNNNYFLSPYGIWKIKLIANAAEPNFDQLIHFEKRNINLELIGRGQYFDHQQSSFAKVCTDKLDQFYEKCNPKLILTLAGSS